MCVCVYIYICILIYIDDISTETFEKDTNKSTTVYEENDYMRKNEHKFENNIISHF